MPQGETTLAEFLATYDDGRYAGDGDLADARQADLEARLRLLVQRWRENQPDWLEASKRAKAQDDDVGAAFKRGSHDMLGICAMMLERALDGHRWE